MLELKKALKRISSASSQRPNPASSQNPIPMGEGQGSQKSCLTLRAMMEEMPEEMSVVNKKALCIV